MEQTRKINRKYFVFYSSSPAATLNLGRTLGNRLEAGSVIALTGELGCGKTLFTRGICTGMGIPERQVNSPTFAFVNEYQGKLPVFHIDLYRLDSITEELGIGILDYLARAASGVLIVEWAEKMVSLLPENHLHVQFEVLSPRKRKLNMTASGDSFIALLKELRLT